MGQTHAFTGSIPSNSTTPKLPGSTRRTYDAVFSSIGVCCSCSRSIDRHLAGACVGEGQSHDSADDVPVDRAGQPGRIVCSRRVTRARGPLKERLPFCSPRLRNASAVRSRGTKYSVECEHRTDSSPASRWVPARGRARGHSLRNSQQHLAPASRRGRRRAYSSAGEFHPGLRIETWGTHRRRLGLRSRDVWRGRH